MLGFNGGLIGESNTPSLRRALSGVWTHREQVTSRFVNSWPQTPTNLASTYIAAVEQADGQSLEPGVKNAYITFFNRLYDDGLIDAIVSGFILCGARTRAGALVPIVGSAVPTPGTSVGYNRRSLTCNLGANVSSRLLTGTYANDVPQDDIHVAIWIRALAGTGVYVGTQPPTAGIGSTILNRASGNQASAACRSLANTTISTSVLTTNSLHGVTRNNSSSYGIYGASTLSTVNSDSVGSDTSEFALFGYGSATTGTPSQGTAVSFLSIGTSIDLALLSPAVQELTETINSVVPS